MNVLYTVAIPAEPERVDRVRSSITQCLDASTLDPNVHGELSRVAGTLLALASTWASDSDGAVGNVAIRIEAREGVCEVHVDARRPSGATFTLDARCAA
jgi:hypothetical protein